jgi:hypothetical protein
MGRVSHTKRTTSVSIPSSGFNAECLVVVSRTSGPNSLVTSLAQANQTLRYVWTKQPGYFTRTSESDTAVRFLDIAAEKRT